MRFPTISVKWLFVVSATVNVEIGGQEGTHAGWLERCSRKYQRPSTQHGGWHCSEPGPCPRANVVAWPGIEVGQLAADATNSFLRAADEMLPALDGALGESAELPLPSASSSDVIQQAQRATIHSMRLRFTNRIQLSVVEPLFDFPVNVPVVALYRFLFLSQYIFLYCIRIYLTKKSMFLNEFNSK